MYFRNFSVALVSTLVASGAYYFYRDHPAAKDFKSSIEHLDSSASFTGAAQQAIEATRKALVIDQGQLFTGTITTDGPISKETDTNGRRVLEMVTPEQATSQLRRNEESYHVGRGKGVVRYDVVSLASNDPIEDDHAEKIIEVPSSITPPGGPDAGSNDWMFWGVFDGHSGWTTSAKLRQALISFVARELNSTYSTAQTSPNNASVPASRLPTPSSIDAAIKRGFLALDTSIVHHSVSEVLKSQSKPKAASLLAPALSGSCALLSFYDSASKTLRVACTGDSRAILGRRSPQDSTKWTAHPLSVDQTGQNAAEEARLYAEHPGEPDVVSRGRVLGGLEPTRAFGDASYKWSTAVQAEMKREYFGRSANPLIRSPPYVTAEPVVTTTRVMPEQGDFVVMATDGLWEMLSNEEVVGLVGQWLERHPDALGRRAGAQKHEGATNSWIRSFFSSEKAKDSNLPVAPDAGGSDSASPGENGQRTPIRQRQWGLSPSTTPQNANPASSRFVVEDRNAATHLIRNALGGGDRDMVCALLTLPSPYSRRYRDDLTVEVIFFGEGEGPAGGSGDASGATEKEGEPGRVLVNQEATRKGKEGKAKAKL